MCKIGPTVPYTWKLLFNETIIINQFYNQVQNTEKLIILKTNHILTLSYLKQHLRSYNNI